MFSRSPGGARHSPRRRRRRPAFLGAQVPEMRRGSRIKMAALIKTPARKQIRRGEKLIKARNIGFQKHTLRLWHGPDYRAHRIHTPQAYWLRQCLICFPQPTHSTLQFTGEGVREKKKGEGCDVTAGTATNPFVSEAKTTMHRTESASRVNMAAQIEREEMARKKERGKSTRY